jgi:hypothetical protein
MASNVLLFLSGVQGQTDDEDITAAEGQEVPIGEGGQGMFNDLIAIVSRSQTKAVKKGFYGSIARSLTVVNRATQFIQACDEYTPPDSKLIIYGYSAGAANALDLCRYFDSWYNSWETREKEAWARNYGRKTPAFDKVIVDLLITVDAAARGGTANINRTVADCVQRNENYFQKNLIPWNPIPGKETARSEGGPNSGKCHPNNHDYGYFGPGHGAMQDATKDAVLKVVREFLGV